MNSWKIKSLCVLILMVTASLSIAETPTLKGVVKGLIIDSGDNTPVEYATISIYNALDNTLVTGSITNQNGVFAIKGVKGGKYNILISFIGYEPKEIKNVEVSSSNKINNLGKILIKKSRIALDEVSIEGNASNVEYKIDKRVVSVSDKLTSSGMSAVEVLENVPSIKVDVDGNIALRGSSSFTVLVDGRPTIMDAADVLQQTPASSIQNIEIITNASAKYSPDGTGGIINIITKKNKNKGISGVINLKAGSFGSNSSDFLLNLRKKKVNYFVSGNYTDNKRKSSITENKIIQSKVKSSGENQHSREGKKLSAGLSWDITDKDIFDISATIGKNGFNNESELDYLTNSIAQISSNKRERDMDVFSFNGGYVHKFKKEGHELSMQFNYRKMDTESITLNTLTSMEDNLSSGTSTVMSGPSKKGEIKIDYTIPLNEFSKFETGIQVRDINKEDISTIERYSNSDIENSLTYDVIFDRNIYSIYSIYSSRLGNLTYQLGLRGEKTVREVSTSIDEVVSEVNDFDFFPTAHFSYDLQRGNQLQISYSRRIERPRGFSLLPHEIWYDMYNVRKGNPDLKNEYVNVAEITYLKDWEKSRLSIEGFYRITENLQERIISVYPTDNIPEEEMEKYRDVTLQTTDNVGKSYSLGTEIMYSIDLFGFWNIACSADGYNYRISSDVEGVKNVNTFNWSASITNKFKINKSLDLQIDNRYNGESKQTQSVRKPMYSVNTALRGKITNNLSLTAQFRNILNTQEFKIETIKEDYQVYKSFKPKPSFMISLSYRINNFRLKQRRNGGDDMFDEEGGMF